jgi:hypothetical protein
MFLWVLMARRRKVGASRVGRVGPPPGRIGAAGDAEPTGPALDELGQKERGGRARASAPSGGGRATPRRRSCRSRRMPPSSAKRRPAPGGRGGGLAARSRPDCRPPGPRFPPSSATGSARGRRTTRSHPAKATEPPARHAWRSGLGGDPRARPLRGRGAGPDGVLFLGMSPAGAAGVDRVQSIDVHRLVSTVGFRARLRADLPRRA